MLGRLPESGTIAKPANWPVEPFERALLTRFDALLAEVDMQFAAYRFDLVSQAIYEFVWNEFCDWSIEFAKPYLNPEAGSSVDAAAADSVRHTLLRVLEAALRIAHPLIPFVTEEIWQHVAPRLGIDGNTIMRQPWPSAFAIGDTAADIADIDWLRDAIARLRSVRSTLGVSSSRKVRLLTSGGDATDAARLARFADALRFLASIERIDALAGEPPACAAAVLGDLRLLIPLEGLIDLDAERARLTKEITRVAAEKEKSEAKLAKFSDKVPAAVVEQERQRLTDWSLQLEGLKEQQMRLG